MKLKHIVFLLFLVIPFIGALSQEDPVAKTFRKIMPMSDSTYLIQTFDQDSTLLFIGTLASLVPEIRNGRFSFYNKQGKVETAGFYYRNIPYGKWLYYDLDGKLTQVIDYKYVLDFIAGNPETSDAMSGLVNSGDQAAPLFDTADEAGAGQPYLIAPLPLFQGKDPAFLTDYIQNHLVYPVYARDMGISGRVFVRFSLDSTGRISSASILSWENPDLSMEALRVIMESTGWTSGSTPDGTPTGVTFTIGVNFSPDR